ncbi:hypothetical protein M085_3974 [Bacteroides fragilis str. 3986 N(B)19]|nr:hypothetical protein M085_3974 [Bacteroides fragilis str. 3986 N(B)19]
MICPVWDLCCSIYLNRIDSEGKTLTKHAFCSFNYKTLL